MREVKKKEGHKLRKKEEKGEKRKREEEKEEYEAVTVKRRCEGFVSVEPFEIFSLGRDLESCGDLSWDDLLGEPLSDCVPVSCELVCVVPDVTDVLVSPFFCGHRVV